MKVNFLLALTTLVTGGIIAGCSPAQYKVNPPGTPAAVPESEQAGYMRILGDLRWDELTSRKEWLNRFPKCLSESSYGFLEHKRVLSNTFPQGKDKIDVQCRGFIVAGIPVYVYRVYFAENSGTLTGSMTDNLSIGFFTESESRAFRSALAQKYPLQTMGHCSKYTCYRNGEVGTIIVEPTPYTISLLDNVQLDKSDL